MSLYSALNKTLIRLAETDYLAVSKYIEIKLEDNKESLEVKSFLNYIKDQVDKTYYVGKEPKWEFADLKGYLNL